MRECDMETKKKNDKVNKDSVLRITSNLMYTR